MRFEIISCKHVTIKHSTLVDDHMAPIQTYEPLRELRGEHSCEKYRACKNTQAPVVCYGLREHKPSTHLFVGLMDTYDDLKSIIPPKDYDGTLDMEMQVIPQDFLGQEIIDICFLYLCEPVKSWFTLVRCKKDYWR